jgi:hypothetical protein
MCCKVLLSVLKREDWRCTVTICWHTALLAPHGSFSMVSRTPSAYIHKSATLPASRQHAAAVAALLVSRLGVRSALFEQVHDAVLLVELCDLERRLAIQVLGLCVRLTAALSRVLVVSV